MVPWEDVLVSLGLDGTVGTIYDQNISRAVKSMQASPPCLMHEAIQKLGTIMQNRSLTTVTNPDVSKDFLSPMQFFQKLIARTYKDIWSHKLTYDIAYSDALRKLYWSRAEVSADRANIDTILAIHEISEHVSAGHFDWSFIENIIGHHISEDGIAKVKDSEKEKLKALYRAIHDAGSSTTLWQQSISGTTPRSSVFRPVILRPMTRKR